MDLFQLNERGELSEYQSQLIVESEEYEYWLSLRIKFLNQVQYALSNGYSVEDLTNISIQAINTNYDEIIYRVLFKGEAEGREYVRDLTSARNSLFKTFPVLELIEIEGDNEMSSEYIQDLFQKIEINWKSYKRDNVFLRRTPGGSQASKTNKDPGKGKVCGSTWQQVKLAACATGCSFASGGIGTALCGWGCWCMLCYKNSEVADAIC